MKAWKALCFFGAVVRADSTDDDMDEPEPAEVADPNVPELLGGDSFKEIVGASKYALVKFYAPWCGHCKAMAPAFNEAAAKLKTDEPDVVLANVDATKSENEALAAENDVKGYPSIFWYQNGAKREYNGPRDAEGIITWVKENMGPLLKEFKQDTIDSRANGNAVYVFESSEADRATAEAVAPALSGFASLMWKAGSNKVTVYKGMNEEETYSGEWTEAALSEWTKAARMPAFGQISEENFEIYTDMAKNGLLWACFDPKSQDAMLSKYNQALVDGFSASGKSYPFVWLDISQFEEHAKEELGCKNYPTLVLQKGDLLSDREESKVQKFIKDFSTEPEALTSAGITAWLADVEAGKVEAEPEPDELAGMDDDEDGAEDEVAEDDSKEEL